MAKLKQDEFYAEPDELEKAILTMPAPDISEILDKKIPLQTSLLKPAMALPLHLYLLVAQGHTSLDMAYGTAFVMMAVILISNALVTMYARRRQRAWKQ